MLNRRPKALRTHPSLFPLRAALNAAGNGVPSRPTQVSADELRALALIGRMRAGFTRPIPFPVWKVESTPHRIELQHADSLDA